ncbi:hypothetical protein A2U01_0065928 [Trifolium medium]|uniref:Uncharacterized protein n=1 Tax=Trifolium medium TaxID=97028 RepID=A0A392S7M4_9FABA|nr:hypothetical protein [Trifolium medium]
MGKKKQLDASSPVEKPTKKPKSRKGAKSKSGPGSSSQASQPSPQIPVL